MSDIKRKKILLSKTSKPPLSGSLSKLSTKKSFPSAINSDLTEITSKGAQDGSESELTKQNLERIPLFGDRSQDK